MNYPYLKEGASCFNDSQLKMLKLVGIFLSPQALIRIVPILCLSLVWIKLLAIECIVFQTTIIYSRFLPLISTT